MCVCVCMYIPLLSSVDVIPVTKTAEVVDNSVHLIILYWIKVFLKLLSLFHLVIYFLQSNTRYFVNQLHVLRIAMYIYGEKKHSFSVSSTC